MAPLHPSVAAVRSAVRAGLRDLPDDATVLVACSGGADSLALAAATVAEGRRTSWRVVGVCVDHQLQEGSEMQAERAAEQVRGLGAAEAVTVTVTVSAAGMGPEAAAREARYEVLRELAGRFSAAAVLLGHTRDDQAETVLLGLARGSGGRALAGMRRGFEVFRRPLLDVTRTDTETACLAEGLTPWSDPHNTDDRFTRVRVRTRVLPALEEELGPGVAAALARTADQLREDSAFLDWVADEALGAAAAPGGLDVDALQHLDPAVRRRVLRLAALAAGAPGAELFRAHVLEVDRLLTDWHGQVGVDLPGHLRVVRRDGVLGFERNGTSAREG